MPATPTKKSSTTKSKATKKPTIKEAYQAAKIGEEEVQWETFVGERETSPSPKAHAKGKRVKKEPKPLEQFREAFGDLHAQLLEAAAAQVRKEMNSCLVPWLKEKILKYLSRQARELGKTAKQFGHHEGAAIELISQVQVVSALHDQIMDEIKPCDENLYELAKRYGIELMEGSPE